MKNIKTAESVTMGHPDKICDQVADCLVDAYLAQDPHAKVAIECLISLNMIVVSGEVKSTASVDIIKTVRQKILAIGYDDQKKGFDAENCNIITNIHQQSPDINQGVVQKHKLGAGDQGTIYGYATNESPDYIPLPLYYSHLLVKTVDQMRQSNQIPGLFPDGKSQVSVEYDSANDPRAITNIVLAVQHHPELSEDALKSALREKVLPRVFKGVDLANTKLFINPTGKFVKGGPAADTGLTGRKLMVDTYGGIVPHGGGAMSGKDPTKVDRSAAYLARFVAKNIVAAHLADRCLIGVSYAIGITKPLNVSFDFFNTEKLPKQVIIDLINQLFDFSPAEAIDRLRLARPLYSSTAIYGHFKNGYHYPWEATDYAKLLTQALHEAIQNPSMA